MAVIHNLFARQPKTPEDFNPVRLLQKEQAQNPDLPSPRNWRAMLQVFKKVLKGETT